MNRASLLRTAAAGLLATALSVPGIAAAQETATYTADLDPLNGSGSSGTATVTVSGDQATVTIEASGLSPGLPHAQHIHIGGSSECPPPSADDNGDGFISTAEGKPFYGAIEVSLTTEGDVGPKSALALKRMPVADSNGTVTYSRTFELPSGVTASDIEQGVIVQHGISELFDDPTQYDGEKESSVPAAPEGTTFEATVPTDCGDLSGAPSGGVAAGAGGTATDTDAAALAAALGALAIGGLVVRRSRARTADDG